MLRPLQIGKVLMKTIDELYDFIKASHPDAVRDGNAITVSGQSLYLSSLKELPEGVSLTAGENLNLSSLKELPEGVSLTAGKILNLRSLKELPEGVSLTAGWPLYLKGLESPYQRYKGKDIYLVNVDGDAMQRLSAPRTVEDCSVWKAAYFNGTENQRTCYVAECGEFTAHGDSIATAIRDVRFKHLQATLDTDQLVEEIKAKGTVTFNEYRLLTGACESGLREGLASLGLPEDTQCLPLEEVIRVSAGQYGGETIERLFT